MPLYIYECHACEIVLEERRSADCADDPVECPVCHAVCARALSTFVIGRGAARREVAPIYGQVPVGYHGASCGCCGPRRRR